MAAPRSHPRLARSAGQGDKNSRAKAETAKERTTEQLESVDAESWPRNQNGRPMVKVTMTAAELIPTGQYANVSVGPAQITAFIDPDREVEYDDDGKPFLLPGKMKETLAVALNELAEVVEVDVVAVQRNLVMESIQEQATQN